MSRDIVQQLNSLIGILCLSRVSDSLLMWSHYADQYAGAVVEFDGSHEFFDGQIDVEYRPLRPMRDVGVYVSQPEPIPVAELCAKSEQWKYEQEVRVIRSLADCEERGIGPRGFPVYTQHFPLECIKSVTLEHFSFTRLHPAAFACKSPARQRRCCANGVEWIAKINLRIPSEREML